MSVRNGILFLSFLAGCDRNLGSIQGFELGNPQSAVWSKDEATSRIAVVASDHDALCAALTAGAAPGTWALWVWSQGEARYESDLPADAMADIRDGVLDDVFEGDGVVQIDDQEGDLDVLVDVSFGEDRVRGTLRASPCEVDLFAAQQGG
jgi:hypothetical protein